MTKEEWAEYVNLENERIKELNQLIQEVKNKGENNLTDFDKLHIIQYEREKLTIQLA